MDPEKFHQHLHYISGAQGHSLRMGDLLRLSLRVFRARPLRTFLTILGVSLGIGAVLFLVSLGFGLQHILIGQLAATEDTLISVEAYYPGESGLKINPQTIDEIIALPESAEISPVAEFPGEAANNNLYGFLLMKIVPPNYFRLSGLKPDIGSYFTESEKSIVISNTALKLFNLKEDESVLGEEIRLKVFYQDDIKTEVKVTEVDAPMKIVGVIKDEFQPPFILLPYNSVVEKPPFYQSAFIKAKDIDNVEALRDNLIEKGFLISARIDLVNQAKKIMTAITFILGIFGTTALVVSAIGMFNTMVIGFLERIFEVGIMKSIGATTNDIRNLFLMESLIMGILGGLGGIATGIGAGEIFNLGLNFLARNLGGKPIDLFIYPSRFLIFIIILSSIVGLISGYWPARRAVRLPPRQAFLRK